MGAFIAVMTFNKLLLTSLNGYPDYSVSNSLFQTSLTPTHYPTKLYSQCNISLFEINLSGLELVIPPLLSKQRRSNVATQIFEETHAQPYQAPAGNARNSCPCIIRMK